MKGLPRLRKGHSMFGWDWGPRIPDAGIWRKVSLLGVHKGCLLYTSGHLLGISPVVLTSGFFLAPTSVTVLGSEERDRKMTYYCFTNECLRDYILRYFGEYGSNYCGNCSNCLSQFGEVDVTEIARVLLGCVLACRQRYGTNVIIDTVHGANTVSYTHLDVYKRQIYACCGGHADVVGLHQAAVHIGIDGLGHADQGTGVLGNLIEPVSYTHLPLFTKKIRGSQKTQIHKSINFSPPQIMKI